MNETETLTPVVKPRLCQIDIVLGKTIGALLKEQPVNPVIRAQVMALIGREIPPELVEYEPIKEWMETNVEPTKRAAMNKPSTVTAFEIAVEFSENEYGTANYSAVRSGSGTMPINVGTLREYIENSESLEDLVELLCERIISDGSDYCDMETGDYDYSDHESSDYSHAKTDYNRRTLEQRVHEWMEDNMPQVLEDWGE